MNFVYYVDELAAEEHRHELEEQARVERLIAEHPAPHADKKRFSLMRWLHLRGPETPTEEQVRRN